MAGLIAEVLGERARTARRRRCWWPRNERPPSPRKGAAERYDYLIVGAGFAGSVLAERLASQHGARVLLIDRRDHIGGNAYDEPDEAGILYHKYGPHIFHTNSDAGRRLSVAVHRVAAVRASRAGAGSRPAGADPDQPHDAQQLFDARPEDRRGSGRLSRLARRAGRRHPDVRGRRRSTPSGASSTSCSSAATRASNGASTRRELDKQVTSRIPTRTNTDDRYFSDTFQAMPRDGYTDDVRADARPSADRRCALGVDFRDVKDRGRSPTTSSTPGRSTNISTSASASCRTAA